MFKVGDYVVDNGLTDSVFLIKVIDEGLNVYFVSFVGTLTKDKLYLNQKPNHYPYYLSFASSTKYSVISEQINKLLIFQ